MYKINISFKKNLFGLIAFFLLLSIIKNLSAQDIQSIPKLNDFPKLPKLPNIEPIRVPDTIKPFNPLTSEIDRPKLPLTKLQSIDKSRLLGEWKSVHPIVVKYIGGETVIEGILFTVSADSSVEKEWTSEGVMYESMTKDGARRFPSSFNYKVVNNLLFFVITFSSNEIKNGVIIPFEILQLESDNEKSKQLKLRNNGNTITLIKQSD